jgi:NADH:ubiquinone oxidoreductase subunit F (NADH-binding)/NADH:ubiquinone oxidoreductase subunit E
MNPNVRRKPIDPEVVALAETHSRNPESTLEIFQALQARHGHLTRAAIDDTARVLKIPVERAYGVASFYSMLTMQPAKPAIRVCDSPACWLRGAGPLQQALEARHISDWQVERTSCLGLCDGAPAVWLPESLRDPLTPLVRSLGGSVAGDSMAYTQALLGETRNLLKHLGQIDPDSIESAIEYGAYRGLHSALGQPLSAVIAEIEAAGLTGRGGAGFPTGRKWRMVAEAPSATKYVVCNADESEPLVFKDRVLIDTKPHQLLEGIAIAAYAVGAREAFIYIRGEYEAQAARLKRAIGQAEGQGLFEHIGAGRLSIHVHCGAGAYICGEETALLESLEGERGEPRTRPPYPTTHGYRGQPTLVNNVETFAAVPTILVHGAAWYRALGSDIAPGTKLYTLLGHVNRPGLFEAPFRLTLRQIIEEFGGGMRPGSTFHFALSGGAAGTIVPPALFDVPIDYGSWSKGVSLGAFLICDESVSPVSLLRELLHFFEVESCGKCTPCRIGTHRAREILDRLTTQNGQPGDVAQLAILADLLQAASFCGLGQSAAVPMRSALQHFATSFKEAEGLAHTP